MCGQRTMGSNWVKQDRLSPAIVVVARTLGWTSSELAQAAGIHKDTICNLETVRYDPSPEIWEISWMPLKAAGVQIVEKRGGGPGMRLGNVIVVVN
jgi:DNA-binding XRE family transcriptional regulator